MTETDGRQTGNQTQEADRQREAKRDRETNTGTQRNTAAVSSYLKKKKKFM